MYICVDFEFNQAFDFPDEAVPINESCRFEIIQIGAVRVDENLNIKDSISLHIKPVVYPRMHPFVTKITGITLDDLKDKPGFVESYKKFREFLGDDRLLCTWGTGDVKALYRNMMYHGLAKDPLIMEYIDVQAIATRYLKFSQGGNIGLKKAVEALELPIEEQFHDACCDALYTARVLQKICPEKPVIKVFNSAHIKRKHK